MSVVRKMTKNTIALLAAQIISTGMGFFYLAIIARCLGDEGFGTISYALALTSILTFFIDPGFITLITRDVARTPQIANKFLGSAILVKLPLSFITFISVCIATFFIYSHEISTVICIITLSMIINSFSSLLNGLFQGFSEMKYQASGQLLNGAIMLVGALLVKQYGYGLIGFAWIYFVAALAVLLYSSVVCIIKFIRPKFSIDVNFIKAMIKESLPYGMSGLFVSIFYWISSIILFNISGSDSAGWYNGAYRLIIFVLFVPSVINVSIFPVMSRLFVTSKDMFKFAAEKYFKYMSLLAIPMVIGTMLLADRIISTIFGPGFENSAIALKILIWSAVFIFLGSPFARLLETSNRQAVVTKITLLCMVTNVTFNLLLIPYYSYVGAAFTTMVTEFISMALCMYGGCRIYGNIVKNIVNDIIKAIISSLVMSVFILSLIGLNVLLLIPLAIIVYFTTLYLLGGFNSDDIALFKSAIKGKVSDN